MQYFENLLDVKGLKLFKQMADGKMGVPETTQAANLVVELVNNNMWHEALYHD